MVKFISKIPNFHDFGGLESISIAIGLTIGNRILKFLDIVVRALCIGKNVTNFTDRKNGGHFERRAAIGRRNTPHHNCVADHTRK